MLQLCSKCHSPCAPACSVSSYSSLPVGFGRVVAFSRRHFLENFLLPCCQKPPSFRVGVQGCTLDREARSARRDSEQAKLVSASGSPQLFHNASRSAEANSFTTNFTLLTIVPRRSKYKNVCYLSFFFFPSEFGGWITCSVVEMLSDVACVPNLICILNCFVYSNSCVMVLVGFFGFGCFFFFFFNWSVLG